MTFLVRAKNIFLNVLSFSIIFPVFLIVSIVPRSRKKLEKANRVIWFGAYGNANLGDDLIFYSLKRILGLSKTTISLSIRNKEYLKNYGVQYFIKGEQFYDYWKYLREIKSADILILGGGGLFEYYYPSRPAFRMILIYLCPLMLAHIFNKPFYVLGVGVNRYKIPNRVVRYIFKAVLSKAKLIITRDIKSKEGLLDNRIKTQIKASYDPVLSLNLPIKHNKNHKPVIGFLLWPYFLWPHFYKNASQIDDYKRNEHKEFIRKVKAIIMDLKENYELKFLTFHFSDVLLYKELDVSYFPKSQLKRFLKSMQSIDLLISMRYHGQITAIINNTPVISLSVQEKMDAFMMNFNLEEYNHNVSEFSANKIVEQVEEIFRSEKEIKLSLKESKNRIEKDIDLKYSNIFSEVHGCQINY